MFGLHRSFLSEYVYSCPWIVCATLLLLQLKLYVSALYIYIFRYTRLFVDSFKLKYKTERRRRSKTWRDYGNWTKRREEKMQIGTNLLKRLLLFCLRFKIWFDFWSEISFFFFLYWIWVFTLLLFVVDKSSTVL